MAIVETSSGKVEGLAANELQVFRGIPYTAPPLGPLRFLPPQPPEPWTETRQATQFGAPAPQLRSAILPGLSERGSEDCLSLNVWTPGCDGKGRPVMVWIHGGSFLVGCSDRDVNNGAHIALRGDVVVVSLNYRVGVFGFLHLAELGGDEFASSGNAGMLDQVAALRWVKDNIAAFGGDPGNVTIFGLSAGGISICALLTMPSAQGLFHRAIAQSGAANQARSAASASTAAEILMDKADVDSIEGLRALPVDALLKAQAAALKTSPKPDVFFGPVVDGITIPEPPLHAIAGGRSANVPMLTGTTLDEMRYWLIDSPEVATVAPDRLHAALRRMVGDGVDELMNAYRSQRPGTNEGDIRVAVLGDLNFLLPAIRMVETYGKYQPNTWLYLFTWPSPYEGGRLGSPHAIDQPFVFGTLDSTFAKLLLGDDPRLEDLSRNVQDAWIAFARNGDPCHEGIPEWPRYEPGQRAVMRFDHDCCVINDPQGAVRRAWDGVPFDGINPPVGIRPSESRRAAK